MNKTIEEKPQKRNPGGKRGNFSGKGYFQPGNRANPGGRPKGLAALVREQTQDGALLIEKMVAMAQGTLVVDGNLPSHQHVLSACEYLTNRGWGKAVDTVHITGDTNAPDPRVIAAARILAQDQWTTLNKQ